MGVSSLPMISEGFISHGAAPETPAAVIENGTLAGQRVITATLATLPGRASEEGIKNPAVIIVGSVVTLRDKLSWFAESSRHST